MDSAQAAREGAAPTLCFLRSTSSTGMPPPVAHTRCKMPRVCRTKVAAWPRHDNRPSLFPSTVVVAVPVASAQTPSLLVLDLCTSCLEMCPATSLPAIGASGSRLGPRAFAQGSLAFSIGNPGFFRKALPDSLFNDSRHPVHASPRTPSVLDKYDERDHPHIPHLFSAGCPEL